MDNETAQLTALYAQNTSQLTRSQRISLRNEIILAKIATGITVEEIQKEFQLSRRQVYNIIEQAEKEVEQWFINFKNRPVSNVLQVLNEMNGIIDQAGITHHEAIKIYGPF